MAIDKESGLLYYNNFTEMEEFQISSHYYSNCSDRKLKHLLAGKWFSQAYIIKQIPINSKVLSEGHFSISSLLFNTGN